MATGYEDGPFEPCKHCSKDLYGTDQNSTDQIRIYRVTDGQFNNKYYAYHLECFQNLAGKEFIPPARKVPIDCSGCGTPLGMGKKDNEKHLCSLCSLADAVEKSPPPSACDNCGKTIKSYTDVVNSMRGLFCSSRCDNEDFYMAERRSKRKTRSRR